jgi:hypothetical protein
MVITQEDVVRVLSNPSLYPEGLEVAGLDVKFSGGKMYLTAESVNYGMFRLRNLSLVGRLVAEDASFRSKSRACRHWAGRCDDPPSGQ